LSVDS